MLQGSRAVGKLTLLRKLAASQDREIIDLDDLATRDAVRADPALFVRGEAPVLIDEFQHVPEVLDAIKAELNRDGAPGRFVLTGSTRYATLPAAAQALTGRAHRVDVLPLSQGEIAEIREDFAETLVSNPPSLLEESPPPMSREEYVSRVVAGGFPPVLRRAGPADRARWFDDYVNLVIERDVLELTRVRQRRALPLLLGALAGQTAQVLNIAKAATTIGMDKSTAESYTKLLETVFLVHQLPAWGTTLGSRVGVAPKIHVVDSGLAARLLRLTERKLGEASAPALTELGHLLETFVVGEICKQLTGSRHRPRADTGGRTTVTRSIWSSSAKTARSSHSRSRPHPASPPETCEACSSCATSSRTSSWEASCCIPAHGHTPTTAFT